MLKKARRTQFFDRFECSDNLLTINVLQVNLSFLSRNVTLESLSFKFLFRHTYKTGIYTLLHILTGANCLYFRFLLFFSFQRAVLKFSARTERFCSALCLKLQCAENVTTVRWNFENLVVFFQELFAGSK